MVTLTCCWCCRLQTLEELSSMSPSETVSTVLARSRSTRAAPALHAAIEYASIVAAGQTGPGIVEVPCCLLSRKRQGHASPLLRSMPPFERLQLHRLSHHHLLLHGESCHLWSCRNVDSNSGVLARYGLFDGRRGGSPHDICGRRSLFPQRGGIVR